MDVALLPSKAQLGSEGMEHQMNAGSGCKASLAIKQQP